MKALVAGWFSFEQMGATAGDLLARDLACEWLRAAGREADVAVAPPFTAGVDWREVDPATYSHVVFVCGPFGNGPPVTEFLERFSGRRLIGLDLSMLDPLDVWNPFDLLLERDSSRASRPDISFVASAPLVPVVGTCLIDAQPEYRERDAHAAASGALTRLVESREAARVEIDTRLDENRSGLRTASEVESLLACMDLVLTTRLHGMVLALKHGVPVLAVDSVEGGGKLTRQAETIGWPVIFRVEAVTDEELERAFDFCVTAEARSKARECAERARARLASVRSEFIAALGG